MKKLKSLSIMFWGDLACILTGSSSILLIRKMHLYANRMCRHEFKDISPGQKDITLIIHRLNTLRYGMWEITSKELMNIPKQGGFKSSAWPP